MSRSGIIVDLFAGGGGASTAIFNATGRHPDVAINHDPAAIAIHTANHPSTRHFLSDVHDVDPVQACTFDDELRPIDLMWVSPDCFPAGTMILTKEGYRPVEEIRPGDEVLTHLNRWRPVTDTMTTERPLMRIRGHGHPGLLVSPEHPFLARSRSQVWSQTPPRQYRPSYSKPDWVKAVDLDEDHYWASPLTFPNIGIPEVGGRGMHRNIDLMWLVGRYLGDGWSRLTETRAELVIICGKHEADELRQILGRWPRKGERAGENELAWHERELETAIQFSTGHRGLVTWLREHFGHGAAEKLIPGWALGMPSELRSALLQGYCSADGHRTDKLWEIQTVSKALAFGVKALVASLGHTGAVYTAANRDVIQGRKVNARQIWRVKWRHELERTQTVRDDGHEWSPIREIEHEVGQGVVFNLSVEDDESYVAEGIVVHNCTHFSKARGGKPVEKGIRSLADVVLVWIDALSPFDAHPRLIALENVEEFQDWGPVLENGQPCPEQKGLDFRRWTAAIRSRGYRLEFREMVAADYGAPTTRKRLKLIARRDADPIIFPQQTHAPRDRAYLAGKLPWRAAAEIIDWSIPVPSIFDRKRPLAPKTLRRIARGIDRFVIRSPRPFIVPVCHTGSGDRVHVGDAPLPTITRAKGGELAVTAPVVMPLTHAGETGRVYDPRKPLRTVTGANRGELGIVAPHLSAVGGRVTAKGDRSVAATFLARTDMQSAAERNGIHAVDGPVRTITSAGGFAGVSAFLKPRYGERDGQQPRVADIEDPHPTVVPTGNGADLAATFMQKMTENGVGSKIDDPLHTAMAQAPRHYQVAAYIARQFGSTISGRSAEEPSPTIMSDGNGGKTGVGAAFLHKYYETGGPQDAERPIDTVTSKARFGLDAAFIEQANTDMVGHPPERPLSTIVGKGCTQRLIDLQLDAIGAPEGSRRRAVLEFLWEHFGEPTDADWERPLDSATARLRFGLVLVDEQVWQIADIGMRMLTPRELFNAQGFPFWSRYFRIEKWQDHTIRQAAGRANARAKTVRAKSAESPSTSSSPNDPNGHAVVSALIDLGRGVLQIHNLGSYGKSAPCADESVCVPLPIEIVAAAQTLAHANSGGAPASSPTGQPNVSVFSAFSSGGATTPPVSGATSGIAMVSAATRSTISRAGPNSPPSASILETLFSFVADAIASSTRSGTLKDCSSVELEVRHHYIIEVEVNGRPITKTAQTSSAGNSVSPPPAEALLRANLTWMKLPDRAPA